MSLKSYALFFLLFSVACNAQQPASAPPIPEGKQVILLDSLEASYWVCRDTKDDFFERIGELDRSIQMRSKNPVSIEEYRDFLRQDVRSFSEKEKEFLEREMQSVYELCSKLSPHLLPDTLRFIKTHGAYYGPSAYYTRENYIVIPENELSARRSGRMQAVLLHELFHVISRYHPNLRQELYALIGFRPLTEPVVIPTPLSKRLLLNPDGADFQWAIALEDTDAISTDIDAISTDTDAISLWVTPLLFSRFEDFNPRRPGYFAHLDFQLFALERDTVEHQFTVQVSPEGKSTLGPEYFVQYRKKIRDNTEYMIHPDEILADNFIWAVQGYEDRGRWDRFSDEGKALLQAIVDFLKKWDGN